MSTPDLDRAFATFAATGDPARLGEVYDALAPELLRVAMHMTRSAAEAEDVLQATFVTAIERAVTFEKGRPIRLWLTGILAHHARAARRSALRTPDPERTRTIEELSPHDHAEQRELFETLDRVLLDLPEAFRPVLVLRLKHGLTAPEIAEALARPPGTVRSQLARGLEAVRRAMPAGLAGAFVVLAAQPVRGLASIRETILSAAAQHAPVAAAITPIAGAIALKKLAVVVAVLVAAWFGWRAVRVDGDVTPLSPTRAESAAVVSAPPEPAQHGSEPILEAAPHDERSSIEAAAAPAKVTTARVEITAVYARDGSPARGEIVMALFEGERLPYFEEHVVAADADGRAVFDSVPPGNVHVRMLQGGDSYGAASAGATLTLRIEQAAGLFVEGEVVDPDGDAVRDASIWSSDRSNSAAGEIVARADGAGRFRLLDVCPGGYLAAISPRRAISGLQILRGSAGDRVHVKIVVDKAGATLRGRVLDDQGKPVARARVMAGDESVRFDQPSTDGLWMPNGAPVRTVTDAEGGYRLEGVPLGPVRVHARGAGFGTTSDEVVIVARGTDHDIVLAPEAIVTGTVRDPRGAAMQGVGVHCGTYPDFAESDAWTDASGRFELRGLSAGKVELFADNHVFPRARIALELRAGETRTWDPQFDGSVDSGYGLILGVLRDEHGAPLTKWSLLATREGSTRDTPILGSSDATGHFFLRVQTGIPYRIVVHAPNEWMQAPRAVRTAIVAGTSELQIVIPSDDPALANVHGIVLSASGEPAQDAQVIAWHAVENVWLQIPVDRSTGSFEMLRLPPGEVDLEVRSTTLPWVDLGARTLEAGARIDLGTIRLPAGGLVKGRIDGASDESLADVELSITDSTFRNVGQVVRHGRAWSSNALKAGKYTVHAHGGHVTDAQRDFEIAAGRDTDVQLALRDADIRHARADGAPAGAQTWVTFVVVGPDGKQACMRSAQAGADGVARVDLAVEPGAWKLLAISSSGKRVETAFMHAAGDSSEIAVRLPD